MGKRVAKSKLKTKGLSSHQQQCPRISLNKILPATNEEQQYCVLTSSVLRVTASQFNRTKDRINQL